MRIPTYRAQAPIPRVNSLAGGNIVASGCERRAELPSERMGDAEPELCGRGAVERFGHVEAKRGSLNQPQPADVDAQPEAEGVGNRALLVAVQVGVADVVKGRQPDTAHAADVVAKIPVHAINNRNAPLGAGNPDRVPLSLP